MVFDAYDRVYFAFDNVADYKQNSDNGAISGYGGYNIMSMVHNCPNFAASDDGETVARHRQPQCHHSYERYLVDNRCRVGGGVYIAVVGAGPGHIRPCHH